MGLGFTPAQANPIRFLAYVQTTTKTKDEEEILGATCETSNYMVELHKSRETDRYGLVRNVKFPGNALVHFVRGKTEGT